MLEFSLPGEQQLVARAVPASESEHYDVIIIGAGPAGTTAAVYSCRKLMKTLVVAQDIGGQVRTTGGIENYAGFQYVTGVELATKFEAQVRQFPLSLEVPARVQRLETRNGEFSVVTEAGRRFSGRSVIIASGKRPRRLGVPGEQELVGRGVAYCATCDAPLYAGRDVAVVGGGNSALTSILDLIRVARKVYSIVRQEAYRADPILVARAQAAPNLERLMSRQVVAILGPDHVTGIQVRGNRTKIQETIAVEGVFVEIGAEPNSEFAAGVVELNPRQEVRVNCRAETSRSGVFAAGDVTDVFEKQIIIAAGDGAKAALAAHAWLLMKAR